jgi:CTP:molybdopterin cytidylyltransferase MocA
MRGRDKLLEDVDGQALLRLMVARARKAGASVVRVVLAEGQTDRAAELRDFTDIEIIHLPAGRDMSDSLKAGIAGLDCAVMILLADLPDLTAHDLYLMLTFAQMHPDAILRAADNKGRAGHPIVFPRDLLPELVKVTGDQGARAVLEQHGARIVHIPLPETRATTDLDTPEDWAAWRKSRA